MDASRESCRTRETIRSGGERSLCPAVAAWVCAGAEGGTQNTGSLPRGVQVGTQGIPGGANVSSVGGRIVPASTVVRGASSDARCTQAVEVSVAASCDPCKLVEVRG